MHRAQSVVDNLLQGLTSGAISSRSLSAAEAATLAASLRDDARDAIYSGALSIAEAIQGIDRNLFTWTTVKLYYSVFYLTRAALGLNGFGIVYPEKTPYAWAAIAGSTPVKRSGTTHKAVLDAFKLYRANSIFLSQKIGAEDPFNWLMVRRESANYKVPKFCEPSAPDHFKFIEKHGVRRPVRDYIADEHHLFTFDPDHAMLAFPIALLKQLLGELKASQTGGFSREDGNFLASQFFDTTGPLPEFRKLLVC